MKCKVTEYLGSFPIRRFNNTSIFFVTSIGNSRDNKGNFFDRIRCWGYFLKYKDALNAVMTNEGDMWECNYYQYVVIEKIKQGICTADSNEIEWFKYVKNSVIHNGKKYIKYKPQWKKCKSPKEAEHTVGWSIG